MTQYSMPKSVTGILAISCDRWKFTILKVVFANDCKYKIYSISHALANNSYLTHYYVVNCSYAEEKKVVELSDCMLSTSMDWKIIKVDGIFFIFFEKS